MSDERDSPYEMIQKRVLKKNLQERRLKTVLKHVYITVLLTKVSKLCLANV